MSHRVQEAIAYVERLDLPDLGSKRGAAEGGAPVGFDGTKDQALVVGADIISFVAGTDPALRTAVMNCFLLAQLAANRAVPSRDDIRGWYEVYFRVLERLGWVVQGRGFSEHREAGNDFEAHRAILSVAATLLGPAPAALAVVRSTLLAMESMADGPWMMIFQQESQAAKAARFQVTVAEPAAPGGVTVSLMAFELDAKSKLTQVLFFKFRSADVTLRHSSSRASVDGVLLAGTAPAVAKKVAAYLKSYVEAIPI
jgi:hypothetical protein